MSAFLFFKGMMGALAPFSYLVNIYLAKNVEAATLGQYIFSAKIWPVHSIYGVPRLLVKNICLQDIWPTNIWPRVIWSTDILQRYVNDRHLANLYFKNRHFAIRHFAITHFDCRNFASQHFANRHFKNIYFADMSPIYIWKWEFCQQSFRR
jgi:hypothetical protein